MKKGVLFTITTFVIFLMLFAFVEFNVDQKNKDLDFANKLSSANNMFYHFDSLETGVRLIDQTFGPRMYVTYDVNTTNFTLKEHLPAKYSDDISRFEKFVTNMSMINVTATNSTKYTINPYNITIENTNYSISSTFVNSSNSSGKVKSIRLDIWTNSSVNITAQNATNSSGVNMFVYVHTYGNGSDKTYNNTLDINKMTNISVKFGSYTANITFGPVAKLNVTLPSGLQFDYLQYFQLSSYGKININSFSSIIVNNTDYGVSKNSTVRVII